MKRLWFVSELEDVFAKIPEEVVYNILGQLPPRDIIAFGATCHRHHRISIDDYLWRPFCFPSHTNNNNYNHPHTKEGEENEHDESEEGKTDILWCGVKPETKTWYKLFLEKVSMDRNILQGRFVRKQLTSVSHHTPRFGPKTDTEAPEDDPIRDLYRYNETKGTTQFFPRSWVNPSLVARVTISREKYGVEYWVYDDEEDDKQHTQEERKKLHQLKDVLNALHPGQRRYEKLSNQQEEIKRKQQQQKTKRTTLCVNSLPPHRGIILNQPTARPVTTACFPSLLELSKQQRCIADISYILSGEKDFIPEIVFATTIDQKLCPTHHPPIELVGTATLEQSSIGNGREIVALDSKATLKYYIGDKMQKKANLPPGLRHTIHWDGGRWVVITTANRTQLHIWDLKPKGKKDLIEHSVPNQASQVLIKGKVVAVGCKTGKIYVFHVKKVFTGKGGKTFLGHYYPEGDVVRALWMDDKELISCGQFDKEIKAYSIKDLFTTYQGNLRRKKKSGAERRGGDGSIRRYSGMDRSVCGVAASNMVVVGMGSPTKVMVWNRYTAEMLYAIEPTNARALFRCNISLEDGRIFFDANNNEVELIEFNSTCPPATVAVEGNVNGDEEQDEGEYNNKVRKRKRVEEGGQD